MLLDNNWVIGTKRTFSWRPELQTRNQTETLLSQVSRENRRKAYLTEAVLLRVLEYYQGIMILTTNRINALDIAVQSRIHLAIRYDDLTQDQRKKIFRMFLDQLREKEPEAIKDYDAIVDWVDDNGSEAKLNGRHIRNVVSSALALARSTAKQSGGDDRLTVKHIRDVMNITKDFQEQLESITRDTRASYEARGSRK